MEDDPGLQREGQAEEQEAYVSCANEWVIDDHFASSWEEQQVNEPGWA